MIGREEGTTTTGTYRGHRVARIDPGLMSVTHNRAENRLGDMGSIIYGDGHDGALALAPRARMTRVAVASLVADQLAYEVASKRPHGVITSRYRVYDCILTSALPNGNTSDAVAWFGRYFASKPSPIRAARHVAEVGALFDKRSSDWSRTRAHQRLAHDTRSEVLHRKGCLTVWLSDDCLRMAPTPVFTDWLQDSGVSLTDFEASRGSIELLTRLLVFRAVNYWQNGTEPTLSRGWPELDSASFPHGG